MSALPDSAMNQLRADFKLVWQTWRDHGEISETEMIEGKKAAGDAIRDHLNDPDWMQCAANHFRQMALQIEQDRMLSQRIAAEVRAEQEMIREAA